MRSSADYYRYWPRRLQPVRSLMADFRRPRDVMEDLRREDPDAHALLSEHLVLPPDLPRGEQR